MPGKRKFEEQLSALDCLRQQPPDSAMAPLRKALAHKNNFVTARAADIVRELKLAALAPELLLAFDRFFDDPVKTDPQCWAKNAISRALAEFEHPDAAVFIRGIHHIQNEPVWGGQSDTAGTLRGTCAHALVQCHSLREPELLQILLELLADTEKSVRVEAARAIAEVNSPAAALVLRGRAVLGNVAPGSIAKDPRADKDETEVLGACYAGVLSIEGRSAIPWLAEFLADGDDASAEAALAIGGHRSPEAFQALHERFHTSERLGKRIELPLDPWFRSVLLSAMALTRQEAALEFLLGLVKSQSIHADAAIEAVVRSYSAPEVIDKLEKLAAGQPRLKRALAEQRSKNRS